MSEDLDTAVESLVEAPARNSKGHWLPGVSGNLSGKPKGAHNFKTIIEELLTEKDIEEIDLEGLDAKQKLMLVAIQKAMTADIPALKMIIETVDGKPSQTSHIDITGVRSPYEMFMEKDVDSDE